jgi:hypothetical protein
LDGANLATLIAASIAACAALGNTALTARSAKRRDDEARRLKTRVAARLVQADLAWNKTRIRQALDGEKYWSPGYSLQQDAWKHQRETLAADDSFSSKEWDKVNRAFRWTVSLELNAAHRRDDTGRLRPTLKDFDVGQLGKASEAVQKAIKILEPYAKGIAIDEDEEPD